MNANWKRYAIWKERKKEKMKTKRIKNKRIIELWKKLKNNKEEI